MKEVIKMESNTEEEYIVSQMDKNMMVIGKMERNTVKDLLLGTMELNEEGSGKMVKG